LQSKGSPVFSQLTEKGLWLCYQITPDILLAT
jgi:hypothetical protein